MALFGSFSRDEQNVYSDIDIAIVKDKTFRDNYCVYHYFDVVKKIKKNISKKFHRGVDIFDLDSNSEFKHSIKKELIYV